jgi:holliday junction DNA helicase RuvA
MITRLTGTLARVLDDEARVAVGAFEYQVMVPEFVRRLIQMQQGKEVAFHTMHYMDGDPSRGKVVPRLVGFLHEADLEFFELFCTVDGFGTKKALKAMARPVKDIADAIQRQDSKWLQTLPGVGAASADKIVAALRRKVARYALAPTPAPRADGSPLSSPAVDGAFVDEAYLALLSLGNSPLEARTKLDAALAGGQEFTSAMEIVAAVYKKAD